MKLLNTLCAVLPRPRRLLCLLVALCLLLGIAGCAGTGGEGTYTVEVFNEAGTPLAGVDVYIYRDESREDLVWFDKTDETGKLTFTDEAKKSRVAVLADVPSGYQVEECYALEGETTRITLPIQLPTDVDLSKTTFGLGDIICDFTVTAADGKDYTLSQLLKEKNAVVLNFWYIECQPCKAEFPYLQEAYEKYGDDIALVAMNPVNADNANIAQFQSSLKLTFPMAACDAKWERAMQIVGYPTTMVVDRYGMITFIHSGSITDATPFETLFAFYGAEDYTQTVAKTLDDLASNLSGENNAGEDTSGEENAATGAEDDPIDIGGTLEFDATVPAGGVMHYNVYKVSGTILTIESADAYVTYNGETYQPKNGVVSFPVSAPDVNTPAKLAIGNKGKSEAIFKVTFAYPGGTQSNPLALVMGDLTTELKKGNDQGVFYTYKATQPGTVTLTPVSATKGVEYDFVLYNLDTSAYRTLSEDGVKGADGKTTLSIPVNAGDTLQLTVGTLPDSENEYPAATIKSRLSFSKGAGTANDDNTKKPITYTLTVKDDGGKPLSGVSFAITVAGKTQTIKTDAAGVASAALTAGDYTAVLTVPAGYIAEKTRFNLTAKAPSVQITLEKEAVDNSTGTIPTTYTVKVVDAAGKAQTGVTVQFYQGNAKKGEQKVNSQGVATVTLMDGTYTLKLTGTSLFYDEKAAVVTAAKPSTELLLAQKYDSSKKETVSCPVSNKEQPAYYVSEGSTYVDLTVGGRSYFLFEPTRSGTFRITTTNSYAKVGYYGGSIHFLQSQNLAEDLSGNAYTISLKEVGPTVVIGVDAASNVSGTVLQITRVGDAAWSVTDEPWVEYKGTTTPSPYTLKLSGGEKLTYVDMTAASFKLVYNDNDGYYHKDSKNGPIVYLKLGAKAPYVSFADLLAKYHMGAYLYDSSGNFLRKEEYTLCMQKYVDCMDETEEVYPLTKDLEYMIRQFGAHQGWWDATNENTYLFAELKGANPDLLWMFALCYPSK